MPRSDSVLAIFEKAQLDEARLTVVRGMPDPALKYIIAMTPRSGSSHLCDVLKNSKAFGRPGEMISEQFIPGIMKNAPGRTADEYLTHVMRVIASPNSVSGLKASWFQFSNFLAALENKDSFKAFRFIHLTRRDLAAQAVSLYRATSSDVFHTNIEHSSAALQKLEELEYDFEKIKYWHKHIVTQEKGWREYFAANNIFPLTLTYEDIDRDVIAVVKRMAMSFGRPRAAERATDESIFRKLGARQSVEWACRFQLDLDAEMRAVEAAAAPVANPAPAAVSDASEPGAVPDPRAQPAKSLRGMPATAGAVSPMKKVAKRA